MKKIFIKYNPYKVETEIRVDNKDLEENSKINEAIKNKRLQEWIENLPELFLEELNDREFIITFHGTLLDFEDLVSVFDNSEKIKATYEKIPAKETEDKEIEIDKIFNKIIKGPFEDLRSLDIIDAFEKAKSDDFEICIVATMSAGKSTLINAMLGTRLMPSKQEACTAIITRIKDDISKKKPLEIDNIYDKNNEPIEIEKKLSLDYMKELNENENISEIRISGNIPFVTSDDTSLVLIDTPGPNNARDPNHKKVQSDFLKKSSKALVLYIMTGEYATTDDYYLLDRIAKSMNTGGKQPKDRFMFVVNKLDGRQDEDGDIVQTLNNVKQYLEEQHNIPSPNLFPATALSALNIRLLQNNNDLNESTIKKIKGVVEEFNEDESFHFEKHASLPQTLKKDIQKDLDKAIEENDMHSAALIHTGIPSIERAIKQHIQKYAKTDKIKTIVDTFIHKVDDEKVLENTKKTVLENKETRDKIIKQIDTIKEKLTDGKNAKDFISSVNRTVSGVENSSKRLIGNILQKFQAKIANEIKTFSDKKFEVDEVKEQINKLQKFANNLIGGFREDLQEIIDDTLVETIKGLYDDYKKKLASLTEEFDLSNPSSIDPLKLMSSELFLSDLSIEHLIQEEDVVVGVKTVTEKKQTRGWFKSIKFWPKYEEITKDVYVKEKREKIDGSDLAQEVLAPLQESLYENKDNALEHALKQSKKIADDFKTKQKELDNNLQKKLLKLEECATDKKNAEKNLAETERNLAWLEEIKTEVESILEI